MKNNILISIIALAIIAFFTLLSWSFQRVDPREIVICQVAFVAVDSETGKAINVSVAPNGISLSGHLSSAGVTKSPPWHLEMNVNGPYRFTWVDLAPTTAVIELAAEGYDSVKIEPALFSIQSGSASGGPLSIHKIKMKTAQEKAINSDHSNDEIGEKE